MYVGIGPEKDTVVTDDQKEFKEMLVEWFYSGSWVKEESEETYA